MLVGLHVAASASACSLLPSCQYCMGYVIRCVALCLLLSCLHLSVQAWVPGECLHSIMCSIIQLNAFCGLQVYADAAKPASSPLPALALIAPFTTRLLGRSYQQLAYEVLMQGAGKGFGIRELNAGGIEREFVINCRPQLAAVQCFSHCVGAGGCWRERLHTHYGW